MAIFGQTETPQVNVARDKSSGASVSTFQSFSGRTPSVLFEDNHLIALYKPAGWQSQPSDSDAPDALSWTKAYLKEKYHKPGNVFLGVVHRLDQPVSGVLIFARTSKGASRLSESIRSRAVEKRYLAWVENVMGDLPRAWTAFLSSEAHPRVQVRSEAFAGSLIAEMEVSVVERLPDRTLVEIFLGTGRKHQIRAMLSHQGFPILADNRYGAGAGAKRTGDWSEEIALLAASLRFEHPTKDGQIVVEAPTSEWMAHWRHFPK